MTRTRSADRGDGWGPGAYRVSVAALSVESVFLAEAHTLWSLPDESDTPADPSGWSLFMLPFLALCGLPVILVLTTLVVLPTATLARRLGRAWWWTPVAAAVPASAVVPVVVLVAEPGVADTALLWTVLWAGIGLPAHLVTLSTPRPGAERPPLLVARTYGYGALAVLLLVGGGGIARGTGLLDAYEPPLLSRERAVGAWTDGRGGLLHLAPDGTATADGLLVEDVDRPFGEVRCDASGTWYHEPGTPWNQKIVTRFDDCSFYEWSVGGTDARPKLDVLYGDPDAPERYVLTRR